MAIDKKEIKQHVKNVMLTTGEVQYPDLLMYVAQQMIHPMLQEVVKSFEAKGLVTVADSDMGAIVTKAKHKKG